MTTAIANATTFTTERAKVRDHLAIVIIFGATLFNFFLCFVNTKIMHVSSAEVIGCEMVLTGTAALLGFFPLGRDRTYWMALLMLQLTLVILLSIAREELMMKTLRDVAIMPIFVSLGLASKRVNFTRALLWLCFFIVIIAFYEIFALKNFTSFFNVKNYFIAKGAASEESFQYVKNNLFVSGTRSNGGYLTKIPGMHRTSGVFLEPISAGFFGFIAGLYFIATRKWMSSGAFWAGFFMSFLMIAISDARMALGCLVLTLICQGIAARMDHRLNLLIFPAAFLASVIAFAMGVLHFTGEDLQSRLFTTMSLLNTANVPILFGVANFSQVTVDSAVSDLIGNQGILGVLLFWLPPILYRSRLGPEARIYVFGVTVYMTFGFMFSAGIFTIKTAALLWFQYGYIISLSDAKIEKTEAPV